MDSETTHQDPENQASSPENPPTKPTFNGQPLDAEHLVLKQINQPYKDTQGLWSDGGTDTHVGNGGHRNQFACSNQNASRHRWLLQQAMGLCVKIPTIVAIMDSLIKTAQAGDRHCAELVLKYSVGDPVTMELLQRMHVLETAAGLKGQAPVDTKADTEATELVKVLKLAESQVA